MKRKALAAIMAVAMAVSMAGCGGSTSESKDSTQKTETADSTASTGGSVENKDKPLLVQPSAIQQCYRRTGQRCSELQRKYLLCRFRCKSGC